MSEQLENICKEPADHPQHICRLRELGKKEEVAVLMEDPGHRCLNCNAVAKNTKNLCNPSPFIRI